MPNSDQPPRPHRGLFWLLFRAPGALVLWYQYHFPKHGDAWGAARRQGNPVIEVLYSLLVWAFVALMIFFVVLDLNASG